MQSEIVGALSPSVSEFKPTKPVINFQASAIPTNYNEIEKKFDICFILQLNTVSMMIEKMCWIVMTCDACLSSLQCIVRASWKETLSPALIIIIYVIIIRIIIITLIIVRGALNSDKRKVICLIIPKGGITHTPSIFSTPQNLQRWNYTNGHIFWHVMIGLIKKRIL